MAKEVDLIDFGDEGGDDYGGDGGRGGDGSGGGRAGGPFLFRTLPHAFDEHGVLPCTASTGEVPWPTKVLLSTEYCPPGPAR